MKGIYRKFTTVQNNLLDKVLKYGTKRLIFSEKKHIFGQGVYFSESTLPSPLPCLSCRLFLALICRLVALPILRYECQEFVLISDQANHS